MMRSDRGIVESKNMRHSSRSWSRTSSSSPEQKKRRVEHSKEEKQSLVVVVTRNLVLNKYVVYSLDESTVANERTVELDLIGKSVWKIGGKHLPGTHASFVMHPSSSTSPSSGDGNGKSKIYRVGGVKEDAYHEKIPLSDQVYSMDLVSRQVKAEPSLISPKCDPILLSIGTKLYALSTIMAPKGLTCRTFNDTPPHFECLDTSLDDPAWVHLPSPDLPPSLKPHLIQSWAVIHDSIILISVEDGATYGFDVTCGRGGGWELLNDNPLPFIGFAFCAPSSTGDADIHYGYSDKTGELSAYRFDLLGSGSFEVPVVFPSQNRHCLYDFQSYLAPLLGDPNKMYVVDVGFERPQPTCDCVRIRENRRIVHARLVELPTTLCDDAVYLKPIGKTTRFRHRDIDAISTDIFVMSS